MFVAPEVIVHAPWRGIFECPIFKRRLCLIAVDEAHCIPEWLDFIELALCIAYHIHNANFILGDLIFENHFLR